MIKPKFFKQYDKRWARYSKDGDTIGASGCGPSAIANAVSVLSALNHPRATPKSVFKWICKHGYFYPNQGTAWSGIPACLKAYGVKKVIETTNSATIKAHLKKNDFVIALMTKSRWTSGGHFVLAYYVSGNTVYISDSASDSSARQKASFTEFAKAIRIAWIIDNTKQYAITPQKKGVNDKAKGYLLYTNKVATVYAKKSTKYAAKGNLALGTKVKTTYAGNGWYKINNTTLKGGYIYKNSLSKYRQKEGSYMALKKVGVRDGYTATGTEILTTIPKGGKFKSTRYRGWWVYVPKQKGVSKAGWVCVRNKKGEYRCKKL